MPEIALWSQRIESTHTDSLAIGGGLFGILDCISWDSVITSVIWLVIRERKQRPETVRDLTGSTQVVVICIAPA